MVPGWKVWVIYMLEKILDLKNTFEGKFLAVLMSVVLVFGMSNFAAFAEGDAGDSTSTPTEQPDPASEDPTSTPPAPDPNGETPGEQQVIQGTVQHGAEAGTNSGGVVVPPPAESNEVDEAVVTFETENAYVSVNDQTFSTPTITTLTTKLHKELKFVASPDTGFEIESVKAKNAAVAEVPITTQDGISTIASDYVDSTLVITVKAKAVETNAPQANETTPITNDTKIAVGGAGVNKLTEEAVTHKVTFTVEGEEYTSQDVEEGATCVEPASPDIPEGFVSFMGWYEKTAAGPGERFDFSTPITQDMELVAKFSDKWVVMFQNADGKIIATQEVANGEKAQAIDGPTPPQNQVFDAWYLDGAPYDFATPITGNITLSPHFLNTYYVYYISKGSAVAPEVVPDGTVVGKPADPERQGYTFSHWSTTEDDSTGPFDFTQPITQDTMLYGIWVPEKVNYTVVYWFEKPNIVGDAGTDLANYQFSKSQTKKALAGSTVKADELYANWGLNRVDYGYYSHGDEVVVAGNGTTVLNVYFKRTLYTVTFNLDGGTMEFNGQTYTDSQYSFQAKYEQDIYDLWVSAANADLHKKDGKKTKGLEYWSGNGQMYVSHKPILTKDVLPSSGGQPTGSITYAAHWDETREAQVNYWLQVPDDDNLPDDVVKKNKKWYSKNNVYTQKLVLGANSNLEPKQIAGFEKPSDDAEKKDEYDFYYDRSTYKLSFNTMGGSSIDPVSKIRYEAPLAKYMENKIPTREGFDFKGWYLDSGYYMPFDAASATMPNANLVLYAKWESTQYSAEFFTHEGDEAPVATQGVADDEYVKDPGTYKLGHFYDGLGEFEGWYWYLPGTQRLVSYSWETPVAGDVQLYAQWKTDGFKVTYETGEGSGLAPVDENEYALDVLAPVQQDTGLTPPDGKIFVGWQVNGQGITYYPGNTVKVSGDITLVARYLNPKNVIYLKFDPNFEGGPAQIAWPAERGDKIAMPDSLFNRVGYDFVSWNASPDGLGISYKPGDIMTLNAPATLYAQWEIKKFNLETDHDEHSTIDPGHQYTYSEDSLEVNFGADDGYGISSITVDGKVLEGEELAAAITAGKVVLNRKSDHRVKVTSASNTITVKKVWNDSLEEKPTIQIWINNFNGACLRTESIR